MSFLKSVIIVVQLALLVFCALCLVAIYGACIAADFQLASSLKSVLSLSNDIDQRLDYKSGMLGYFLEERVPPSVLADHVDIKKPESETQTLSF